MESSGQRPVRGHAITVDKVIQVLKSRGVEIAEDGVRLVKRARR
jgi:hypothetical protein